jgi:hypothetical protein
VNVVVVPDTTPGLYVHPVVFARKDDKVYFTDPMSNSSNQLLRLQFPIKPALAANTYTGQGRTCICTPIIALKGLEQMHMELFTFVFQEWRT